MTLVQRLIAEELLQFMRRSRKDFVIGGQSCGMVSGTTIMKYCETFICFTGK